MEQQQRRRPTRQLERLLDAAMHGREALERSRRHCELSDSKDKTKWLSDCERMDIQNETAIAICEWALGIGLLPRELERVLTEEEP